MFHNIFTKTQENKKIKSLQFNQIVIDIHEKNSLVASYLVSFNMNIEFKHLEIADYMINNIAIERKSFSDLQSSIINKRIFQQLENLKQFPQRLLIIESFSPESATLFIHENALRGFLLSVTLDYQTPIIFTQNEKDTANYLTILAKKTEKSPQTLRPSRISLTKEKQIQYILEGFPQIGPATAKKLIKKFHSLKNIINASEEELKEILRKRTNEFKSLIDHD